MKVLKATFAIDRVSVSPIGERRALVVDRVQEHLLHDLVDTMPFGFADAQTQGSRVDRSSMENFGRIEVAHACHEALIEQSGLDWPLELAVPLMKLLCIDLQRVGPEDRWAEELVALICRPDMGCPQSAAVPIEDSLAVSILKMNHKTDVFESWRIGDQGQACHFGLQDNLKVIIESDQNPFGDSVDPQDRSAH